MSEYIKKTDIANIICRLEPDPDFQKKEHKFWEDISNEIFSMQGCRDAQPDNEPLTLEQLRGMEWYEPVYVKFKHAIPGKVVSNLYDCLCYIGASKSNYGKTWLACCYKLKEEHHEAN